MNTEGSDADTAADRVERWLRDTLPDDWVAAVDAGMSPRPPSTYDGFDVDAWHQELFECRFLTAGWPEKYGGLGWSKEAVTRVHDGMARYGAPVPIYTPAVLMVGGAILADGTEDQQERFLPRMATGRDRWTQLFSEPDAGSDLASLRTRARREDASWVVNGQKVWSSFAHQAEWGLLLARTNGDRHRGITCFIVDMHADGVDVRPLRQITGGDTFNEVFLDDVVVADELRVGPVDDGWRVAMSALQSERSALSSHRVGGIDVMRLIERHRGRTDAITRQRLADAYVNHRVAQLFGWRGYGSGDEAQVTKLHQTESNRALQELVLDLESPAVLAFEAGDVAHAEIVYGFLRARANTIAGGTSEIMRNVIGERLLGLPRGD